MKIIRIGKENSAFQHLETLRRNRHKRHRSGEFVVEGVRAINNAVAGGWDVRGVIFSDFKRLSGWARDIVERNGDCVRYQLTPDLLAKISDKEDSSELMLLLGIPEDDLSRIAVGEDLLVVVMDQPTSPGNLGSVIRSADAFGAHGVVVLGHSVDVYDQNTVSASTGSLFSIPVVRLASQKELAEWVEDVKKELPNIQVLGSDEDGDVGIGEADYRKPTVLMMGNEKHGLCVACREMADSIVSIPMRGSASSLNVASATSIFLYEASRQRQRTARAAS